MMKITMRQEMGSPLAVTRKKVVEKKEVTPEQCLVNRPVNRNNYARTHVGLEYT